MMRKKRQKGPAEKLQHQFQEMACEDPNTNWKKGDPFFCKRNAIFFPHKKHDIDFLNKSYTFTGNVREFPTEKIEEAGFCLCPSRGFEVKGDQPGGTLTRVRAWNIGYQREGPMEFSKMDSPWMDEIVAAIVRAMKRIRMKAILYFVEMPLLYADYEDMENEAKFRYIVKGTKKIPKDPISFDFDIDEREDRV